jgi:rare lipoprotein A
MAYKNKPARRPTAKTLALGILLLGTAGLTALPATPAFAAVEGVASYYGKRFHGRKTASGVRFDMNRLTAAHKKWSFGTRVKVTNKSNGRSVVVTVNDRGPFVRGRTIDLSYAAAREIGMINSGVARVKIEHLGRGSPKSGSTVATNARKPIRTVDDLF